MIFGQNVLDLEAATKLMQEKYPGNYQVVEKYDLNFMKFTLQLEFEDKQEEMMFLLKWL